MTYAEAATLPGLTRNAVKTMVYRGSVAGSEGFVESADLLRHLERESPYNRQYAAAKELRRRLELHHS